MRIVRIFSSISECIFLCKRCADDRPVRHRSVYYNCRVIVYNKYIYLIRPKLWLANDGNYRERRYFQCWRGPRHVEEYDIPLQVLDQLARGQVRSLSPLPPVPPPNL
jgi:predicted amidohydrolase